jgi:hypothetical protein
MACQSCSCVGRLRPMVRQTGAAFTAFERAEGGAPVGVSLPANALGQSMHQGLAKCISRASAPLQAINCASGFLAGARSSGVLDGRPQQWQTWIVIGRLRVCRAVNGSGCLHTFVGARLPANALGQSMHQCLAKCISRASALLQAINCAFRVPGGAGDDPDQASTVGFTRCELAGKRSASAYPP